MVVSERVPCDWARVMNEPLVYLVIGIPYSPSTLERAGFLQAVSLPFRWPFGQAKSVVIYQKDVTRCSDAPLIDAQARFKWL